MTETKKSSDVYGASLGLHTTVNIGVRFLNPTTDATLAIASSLQQTGCNLLTSNRKFRAARNELKEIPSFWRTEFTHHL